MCSQSNEGTGTEAMAQAERASAGRSANPFRAVYRSMTSDEIRAIELLKDDAWRLYRRLDELPASRYTALAKTKLEESIMWAVKGMTA